MKYLLSCRAIILLFLAQSIAIEISAQDPHATKGILNAREWNLAEDRLALSGDWSWYDNQLLDPKDIGNGKRVFVEFPKLWNDTRTIDDGIGYATYALTVLVPSNVQEFGVEIPQIYSSYRLWVNGQLVAENGSVGINPESSTPQWMPQLVSFHDVKDSLQFVMQIANYHHSKGGCKEPIYLGEHTMMGSKDALESNSAWAECILLVVLAILFLGAFLLKERNLAPLYFALLCLSWSTRSAFANRYIFISVFPDFDWTLMVQLEYGMLFLTMIWGILWLDSMFKAEVNTAVKFILIIVNVSFLVAVMVTPPLVFTRWLPVYLAVSGGLLFYGAVIVIRAWINERVGSAWLAVSAFWMIGLFAYDILAYEGLFGYNTLIFSAGYILVYSFMGMAILYHLGVFKSSLAPTRLTFDEMVKKN